MSPQSLAEVTGLYGFAVSVLAANGSGLRKDRVLAIGSFFQQHPDLAMMYLRRAEGYGWEEVQEEVGINRYQREVILREEMVHMASLLDPCVVV